jgi:Histidine kinase
VRVVKDLIVFVRHIAEFAQSVGARLVGRFAARFAALQAQVNPHFLFNTLNQTMLFAQFIIAADAITAL